MKAFEAQQLARVLKQKREKIIKAPSSDSSGEGPEAGAAKGGQASKQDEDAKSKVRG